MIFMDRHNDGFMEDLQSVDDDVKDVYTLVMDIKGQHNLIYLAPVDFRDDLIRTINYSIWCINASFARVIKSLREIEDYVAVGLAEADDLDEDDPVMKARKVEFLTVAQKLAAVLMTYGHVITYNGRNSRTTRSVKDMQFIYNKLAYIAQYYQVNGGGERIVNVDEDHRSELMAAKAAVAAAQADCHYLIVDECLTEMADIAARHPFVYTNEGYMRKWKSRAVFVGRYFMNLWRAFRR